MTTNRQPSGTPVGGQFAASANASPDAAVELTEPRVARHPRRDALDAARARAVSADAELERQTKAMIADYIVENHPDVASFTMSYDDEYDCAQVSALYGRDGQELEDDDLEISDGIDNWLSGHSGSLSSLTDDARESLHPGYDEPIFTVADELATPVLERGSRKASVHAGEMAVAPYLEAEEDEEHQVKQAIGDLLTDLRHYAHQNGLDFSELVSRVEDVAAEEETLWQDDE